MLILIVDDERIQRETLAAILEDQGHETVLCANVSSAVEAVRTQGFQLVLTDFKMPDGNGVGLAKKVREISPQTPVIIMTAYADVQSVLEAMRAGVVDYFLKPLNAEHVIRKVSLIHEQLSLQSEVFELRRKLQETSQNTLLGHSPAIDGVRRIISNVATTKGTVLITGESGTGKEVVARLIHTTSGEPPQKFVAINCAAIPENLMESELFGHKKGSFTGALQDREGLLKQAHGGTLFLDEIGELPKSLQAKLLRVLQEKEFTPVGCTKPVRVEFRLIAATNRDLGNEVQHGHFRQDLFYRINVVEIKLPALRDRLEDVSLLADFFIEKYARELSRRPPKLTWDAANYLRSYSWPGNVRELQNVIERALILGGKDGLIEVQDLPESMRGTSSLMSEAPNLKLSEAVDHFARMHIHHVLETVEYDKKEAARILGLGLSSLYRKMDELGIMAGKSKEISES